MTEPDKTQTPEADRVASIYAQGKLPNFNMLYFAVAEEWQQEDLPDVDGTKVPWNDDSSLAILHALRKLSRMGALKEE